MNFWPFRRARPGTLTYYRDMNSEWRWKLAGANGEKLAHAGESFKRREDAEANWRLVRGLRVVEAD